ncbi:hypothetical protein X777_08167 [Ooceraea biroi]|uniref:Uncharacterized protein n=1 Tax=Ooceraea biroi TaxID=2015173 RepID=A0A026WY01_OOCBI|nr:hypothetical protein X777_08167 [Ooceraea biroi]
MCDLSESFDGSANDDTGLEQQLEESLIVQDDYKKLKQENECYRQQLHVLRLKLAASNALEKELQESNEGLERSLAQCTAKAEEMFSEKEGRYKIKKEEYENYIADLETDAADKKCKIMELHEELRKYKDLINKCSHSTTVTEDTSSAQYKEKIEQLLQLLQNEEKKGIALEERLRDTESQYQEIKDILKVTKEQLVEKSEALQNTREELAMNRLELESLKVTPASDTCKGNSLFAEVEDRRQVLLDKMKALQCKYNEMKRILNVKTSKIDLLKAEKAAMVRKWETDAIDAQQEDADLLEKYKIRIVELENKLKAEIKNNKQAEEVLSTDDNFSYTQSLLIKKKKEIKELNERIERQAMLMLMQEDTNHNISRQLRFWQTKAMMMKAEILSIKAQLQTEQAKDDNKNLLEAIENCKITDITDFEKTCDTLKSPTNDFMLKNDTSEGDSTRTSEKPIADKYASEEKQHDRKKVLRFVTDTKETEKQSLKKHESKQHDNYPIVTIE